jgi:phospholipid/cholesterol/gamma-HCH transport system ATP-binding protein
MLYDEPTTGLDPITCTTITDLIVKARDIDKVASIMVTHQLRDAFNIARTFVLHAEGEDVDLETVEDGREPAGTDFLMLREGQVHFEGTAQQLRTSRDAYIQTFLA